MVVGVVVVVVEMGLRTRGGLRGREVVEVGVG